MSKIAVLSKLTYRFNAILIKFPIGIFEETDKLMLNLIWKCKEPRRAITIPEKNKVGAGSKAIFLYFKTYYKATQA